MCYRNGCAVTSLFAVPRCCYNKQSPFVLLFGQAAWLRETDNSYTGMRNRFNGRLRDKSDESVCIYSLLTIAKTFVLETSVFVYTGIKQLMP